MPTLLTKQLLHTTDAYIKKLAKAGVSTVEEMIGHYPRTYENRTNILEHFSFVNIKEKNSVIATIESIIAERTRNGKQLIKAILRDKSEFLCEAVWFNRQFLLRQFHSGDKVVVFGQPKYEYGKISFTSPDIDFYTDKSSRFEPVYPELNYIGSAWFVSKMPLLKSYFRSIPNTLPEDIRIKKGFRNKHENLTSIHFPKDEADFGRARDELAYEELFLLQYEGIKKKQASEAESMGKALPIPLDAELVKDILEKFPFPLTNHQKIATFQILKDMERPYSMNRLLQGDVGTGKTAVAMIAAIHAILKAKLPSCQNGFKDSLKKFPPVKGNQGGLKNEGPLNPELTEKSKDLRKNMPEPEKQIWFKILSQKQFEDLKFTRQKPLLSYIVDFYCAELKLAIEIDDDSHAENKEYDQKRIQELQKYGVEVIRYVNHDIMDNIEGIYTDLIGKIETRRAYFTNPPTPLDRGGACEGGIQIAFMVPTEILARQHFASIQELLSHYDITSDLLVGSLGMKQKKEVQARLKSGQTEVVIGTHALIQDDVHFQNLAFVIIDEQHRFGVEQRKILEQYANFQPLRHPELVSGSPKSYGDAEINSAGRTIAAAPHVLHMTATPIPRTLALTIYGDQDISTISEYPVGRKPIHTKVIKEHERDQVYRFIEEEVRNGHQVYWISPLVEESETLDISSAISMFENLEAIFPTFHIGLLHGRMKGKEKDEVMERFLTGNKKIKYPPVKGGMGGFIPKSTSLNPLNPPSQGEVSDVIDILSSTSVVEVGVNNPNATVICIEASERFGLSQLHQFRGRVGRGYDQSYCYLFTTKSYTGERLRAMEQTNNGFELAEIDLELRGPGEVYGVRQSGIPDFRIADLKDFELISEIREDIEEFMKK